jgi:[NiFe] hydrogenase diaphorase moiety small subunit
MTEFITFKIDGVEIKASANQTILEAADAAGVYIPRLCHMKGLTPHGSCRVCTVKVNGRSQAACTQPAANNLVVENNTPELAKQRRNVIEMLFVEGNHFCMFCEKSGNCELQAVAYRMGITAPQYKYQNQMRTLDATHPDVLIDRNRCIHCGRCVNASRDVDKKTAFEFVNRGADKAIAVDSEQGLSGTSLKVSDKAAEVCPVGCITKKRVGYAIPVGQRKYDVKPIGSDVEGK